MKGKVSLVTGAGGGIGRAIATVLAGAGSDLVLWDSAEISPLPDCLPGTKITIGRVDVTDPDAVEQAVADAMKSAGAIDLLVNNAGITRDNLIFRMKPSEWDQVISVNLTGAFNCTRSAARQMARRKSGSIVNISSVIGLRGNAGQANYGASKAGLIGLTKSAARELAHFGIRVNAIAPGYIVSPMTDRLSENQKAAIAERIPMRTLGAPGDVARAVLFFASSLSSYVTGAVLAVDGGFSM